MNTKLSVLTGAVAATLALGMANPAAASVYGRSYLDIDSLEIHISDDGGITPDTGGTVDNFNFALTNTVNLNGAAAISIGGCSGTPGAPGVTNNCSAVAPRANAAVLNLGDAAATRAENTFDFKGPGLNEYANSDSVIFASQLTGDVGGSNTEQIAESELQTGVSAGSSAEIISTTGFTFQFTVDGANTLTIDFDAMLDILARIDDPTAAAASAQSNVRVSFRLENDDTGDSVTWNPNGDTATGCTVGGLLLSCLEVTDGFDLNSDAGTTTDGTSVGRSGSGSFSAVISGLFNGNWTLTLDGLTSTALSRTPAVPEPASLALLGIGLAGARRRRKA